MRRTLSSVLTMCDSDFAQGAYAQTGQLLLHGPQILTPDGNVVKQALCTGLVAKIDLLKIRYMLAF
jgi:hypothetical protein